MDLRHGDCLQILKDISSNSVDLVICDLPFGCLAQETRVVANPANNHRKEQPPTERAGCAWDIPIDLDAFWTEIRRIRRNDHTPCIHFCTTKYGFELYESNKKEFRYDLVWNKERGVSFLAANKMPMRSHEMVYVFSKAGAYYNRIDISGDFPEWNRGLDSRHGGIYGSIPRTNPAGGNGTRCVLSVIDVLKKTVRGHHPTEKPVELYKFLIERYCPSGGTVLDPTFGSGNSGLAARQLHRKYIGIEKDEGYFKKFKDKVGL